MLDAVVGCFEAALPVDRRGEGLGVGGLDSAQLGQKPPLILSRDDLVLALGGCLALRNLLVGAAHQLQQCCLVLAGNGRRLHRQE